MEDLREAVHALLEERLERLRRDVAPGEAGAAGGDDDVDRRIGDPAPHDGADVVDVVRHDLARGETWPASRDALGERVAGVVVGERARVGDRQHRDADGDEGAAGVGILHAPAHGCYLTAAHRRARGPARLVFRARIERGGLPASMAREAGTVWKASRTLSGIGARR